MIRITRNGIEIDGEGWSSANPSERGIEVNYSEGVRVFIAAEFLRHAVELLDWDRKQSKKRRSSPKGSPA